MAQHRFHKPSEEELNALQVCQNIIKRFREEDSRMPSSYMEAFIVVAKEPGKGPTGYAEDMKTIQPIASRVLLEIGPKARQRPQTLELVDRQQKPDNWREQEYFLTPKGRKLMRDLVKLLEPQQPELQKPQAVQPNIDAAVNTLLGAIPMLDKDKAGELAARVVAAALSTDKVSVPEPA